MNSHFKAVAFDLDGTLVNSLPDLHLAVNSALMEFNLPETEQNLVMTWVGNGANVLIQRAIEWAQNQANKQLSKQDMINLTQRFDYYYGQNICTKSVLYPQVTETLAKLKQQGYHLAVISNKPTHYVLPVLDAFHISHFFDEALGGQSLPAIKPHPAPIYYVCGKFGIYPKQLLFVGDSQNDILAAHAAGSLVVGLTYGYNYNVPIETSKPDWVFNQFADLLTIL